MPYLVTKLKNSNCYQVKNKSNGRVLAKCSSLANATKQIKLLRMIGRLKGEKNKK